MKPYKSRRVGTRRAKNNIVIVCEGEKTEVQYFEGFRKRNSGVNIRAVHGKCTDPKSIVDFAKDCVEKWDVDFDIGDGLWCVFDVDENADEAIENAKKLNIMHESNGIDLFIRESNPSSQVFKLIDFIYELYEKNGYKENDT